MKRFFLILGLVLISSLGWATTSSEKASMPIVFFGVDDGEKVISVIDSDTQKEGVLWVSIIDEKVKDVTDYFEYKDGEILKANHYKNEEEIPYTIDELYRLKPKFVEYAEQGRNELLYDAASGGNLEYVKRLIKLGANINYVCRVRCQDWTPVMIAAANGHLEVVQYLLKEGANPNAQNRFGRTAILFATRYRFKPIVEVLLDYGADPTITSQDKNQNSAMADALTFSLMDPSAYEILKVLVKRTKNIDFNFWDFTPLMLAVKNDDYDFAKYLLENGADPNHFKIVQEDGKNKKYDMKALSKSERMSKLIDSYQK